jgi:hypothetical protein
MTTFKVDFQGGYKFIQADYYRVGRTFTSFYKRNWLFRDTIFTMHTDTLRHIEKVEYKETQDAPSQR